MIVNIVLFCILLLLVYSTFFKKKNQPKTYIFPYMSGRVNGNGKEYDIRFKVNILNKDGKYTYFFAELFDIENCNLVYSIGNSKLNNSDMKYLIHCNEVDKSICKTYIPTHYIEDSYASCIRDAMSVVISKYKVNL